MGPVNMAEDSCVVAIKDLRRSFVQGLNVIDALRGVSFELRAGEFVGISGPSGCGKSTLLNILGLTDAPSAGEIFLLGARVAFQDEPALTALRRTKLGYVFQYFNLLPSLSALENVMLSLLLNGVSTHKAQQDSAALLSEMGLKDRLAHYPDQLSGGEMQRVALCRAVIHRPVLLLADEPTGNLDSTTGGQVLELLARYAARGTLIVMASHSQRALDRCSRVITLSDGSVVV